MNSLVSNRNTSFDLLKGIAVILMIHVHIIELFADNEIFKSMFGKISLFLGGAPVAPLFLIIFGYFVAASKKSDAQQFIRGVKIFLLGMLLNCGLNLNLILSVLNGTYEIDLLPYVFGVDVLQCAGLSLIIITFLKKLIRKSILAPIIGVLVILIITQLVSSVFPSNATLNYFTSFIWGSSHWSYFPLLPWLAYPLSGIVFYQLNKRFSFDFFNSRKSKFGLTIVFTFFIVFTLKYAITVSSNLNQYYHHGFLFFGWTIAFSIINFFFINELNKMCSNLFIAKYVRWLGKNVTLVYIIQWLIIGNTATEIYKTISSPLVLSLSFIGILSVTSVLTLIALKIKGKLRSNKEVL